MDKVGLIGKYQTYPEYKDSGVIGLDKVPTDWNILKVKYLFNIGRGRVISEQELEDDGQYPVYSSQTKNNGCLGYINTFDFDCNQITWTTDGANAGTVFLRKGKHNCTNVCGTLQPKNIHIHMKYILYCLEYITQFYKRPDTNGAKIMNNEMAEICVALPPCSDEAVIANFLDHETAKIDTLIDKQQQLIKLLKEKRQAVISHAVTKGLNPNAPKRDSGVEWLGEVPEHWEVSKFGYVSQVVRGGSPRPAGDPTLFNGDYSPWVTVAEITKDDEVYLTSTETFLTKKGSDQCRIFKSGTLLLSNSGATLGVPSILNVDANANDGVVGFENLTLNSEFAYYYLSSLTEDLRERVKQGSGQPNLNTDIVKGISVPIPPELEVKAIVDSIRKTRDQFKKLTKKAFLGIELLLERRTALISAAVTGKIDVRDWVAPEPSNNTMESRLRGNDAELNAVVDLNKDADLSKEAGL